MSGCRLQTPSKHRSARRCRKASTTGTPTIAWASFLSRPPRDLHLDPGVRIDGRSYRQAIGHDSRTCPRWADGNHLKDGTPTIHEDHLALMNEPSRRLSNRPLGLIRFSHALLIGKRWGTRKGSPMTVGVCQPRQARSDHAGSYSSETFRRVIDRQPEPCHPGAAAQ